MCAAKKVRGACGCVCAKTNSFAVATITAGMNSGSCGKVSCDRREDGSLSSCDRGETLDDIGISMGP